MRGRKDVGNVRSPILVRAILLLPGKKTGGRVNDEGRREVRYSLRYAELAAFVMAAQEQRLVSLEARLDEG
jgi:hypothetical protein